MFLNERLSLHQFFWGGFYAFLFDMKVVILERKEQGVVRGAGSAGPRAEIRTRVTGGTVTPRVGELPKRLSAPTTLQEYLT